MPSRHRSALITSLLAGSVGLVPLLVALAPPASAAAADVKINEIVSNGPAPDSIELTNIGAAPVDLSGWILKDDKDASSQPIPAGTTLPAGGFLSFPTTFGLGNGDAARVFLPDGTTLVDGHTFPSHSNPSWSRCPDGTGAFVQAQAASLGAANACTVPDTAVRINEVESSGGSPGDWVELLNTGTGAVDASGWVFRDADDTHAYVIPAGTSIPAGGYFLLEEAAFGFGLGQPDSARLLAEDGTTVIDSYAWTTHATTSYGRCPNGTGNLTTTTAPTKGAVNTCPTPAGADALEINEVKTNPNPDFVEVRNVSDALVDVADFWVADSAASPVRITSESTPLQPGELFAFNPDEIVGGFGLGAADSVTILLSDKTTVVDTYAWTTHRLPSYGRCPDGPGLVENPVASPGAENVCQPVRINEVESSGGQPGDWVELVNVSAGPVDVSGWVLKDADDTHSYAIPAATTIAVGGYLVLDEAAFGFGLGQPDAARLFRADGTTLVDSYAWTTHATTSYGRCADGAGAFVTTEAVTKGAANLCPPPFFGVDTEPWPGSQTVTTSDPQNAFVSDVSTGDVSGLAFSPTEPGVLWAIKNKNRLFKLTKVGGLWTPLTTDGWATGKALTFADGSGEPDTEGVTVGPDGAIYATTERDNTASSVPLNQVLRFDPTQPGPLRATATWNLNADFPELAGIAGGSNLGFEGLTWVPDSYLVAGGFVDESTGAAYRPSSYAGHGDGLFVMALENDGALYAYALGNGLQHRVAKVASGFPHVMDVSFDPERQQLWAVCDDTCQGQVSHLRIGANGKLGVVGGYERPTGMPNLNNEGFALAPQSTCVDGAKEVVWSDDAGTGGHSLRSATLPCTGLIDSTTAPQVSGTARSGETLTATAGTWSVDGVALAHQWRRGEIPIEGATGPSYVVTGADKGAALNVVVTASKTGYADETAASAPVTVEDLPLLVTAPAVSGSGRVGDELAVSTGGWDETGLTFAYQWLRSGAPIAGATSASYTPTAADLAAGAVSARVTATRPAGGASGAPATTEPASVVAGDAATATAAPRVSGTPVTGQRLVATSGSWSVPGLAFGYQWLRDGAPIAGATASSYRLVGADQGRRVAVRVTAARAGHASGTATSAAVRATGPAVSRTRLSVARKVTAGKRAAVTVRVTGAWDPTGTVTVLLDPRKGRTVTKTVRLRDGVVRFSTARLVAGTYQVRAVYAGDALHRGSATATRVVVKAKRGR
ncbi:lamin tail domain-containing protein [Nocardioides lianchengensis]|uniref:Esterase-like activity of phytase n=1 Tax=Nocardioides lianchengensis TaxID=1045774 RepID=A0A1G6I7T7_9ACTN|nr:lamin tail domain-containing protein [Nocardioides lianchengensis]NYG13160.1 hypothetical protein [Nocardioides lianchengensis]SDC01816.1 Esterase-like activity of phytase [Nocardioides lianchengensis]